jgi:hypothetical protein
MQWNWGICHTLSLSGGARGPGAILPRFFLVRSMYDYGEAGRTPALGMAMVVPERAVFLSTDVSQVR